jgi:hypothetical protein
MLASVKGWVLAILGARGRLCVALVPGEDAGL